MSKFCPILKEKVVYIACLECDKRDECKRNEEKLNQIFEKKIEKENEK